MSTIACGTESVLSFVNKFRPTPVRESSRERKSDCGSGTSSMPSHFPVLASSEADAADLDCKESVCVDKTSNKQHVYHAEVQLPNGRIGVMLDIGSVGNLAGEKWVLQLARKALEHGRRPEQIKRGRPLAVCGVGTGSQSCTHNCHIPCVIESDEGYIKGMYKCPLVPGSDLPALLGLESLSNSRAIIDTIDGKLYFLGPGDYDLKSMLPPGTKCIQCIHSPSGHLMMPVDSFARCDEEEKNGGLDIQEIVLPVKVVPSAALPTEESGKETTPS